MARFSYQRQIRVASARIKKHGWRHKLRRDGVDRWCQAVEVTLSTAERRAMVNQDDSIWLISVEGLIVAPDKEQDEFVVLDRFTGEELEVRKIVAPVAPLKPGGVVIYYEIQTRG